MDMIKFARIQDPIYTQIDDEVVVMGPKDDLYYGLNPVGAEIWNLLESKPMSLEEITTHLQAIYELDEAQAITDVKIFINDMITQALITTTS